ncbi:hypothetical protein ACIPDW_08215 [Streptomyces sp. NPDC087290]|uniref:hypothetical protein n=1 Tax=Streptomyces sp. NPDC087290 TaxID=3365776 RepID=UPI0037FE34CA
MSTSTMSGLSAAVAVLASLTKKFPDLPAPEAQISRYERTRVELSFYDDLGAFEAWRSALGIDPARVRLSAQSNTGPLMWLSTDVLVDTVDVHLVGFGTVPKGCSGDDAEPLVPVVVTA